jgi:hypothetical protein
VAGGVVALVLVLAGPSVLPHRTAGTGRMAEPRHGVFDPRFPGVDLVSGAPSDWLSAVCQPVTERVAFGGDYRFRASTVKTLLPNTDFDVPGAELSATCYAKVGDASDPLLLVARYRHEDAMQRDLENNAVRWYCFAVDNGTLLVVATRAEERTSGSNGFSVSPVLDPLTRLDFNVYSGPGP